MRTLMIAFILGLTGLTGCVAQPGQPQDAQRQLSMKELILRSAPAHQDINGVPFEYNAYNMGSSTRKCYEKGGRVVPNTARATSLGGGNIRTLGMCDMSGARGTRAGFAGS